MANPITIETFCNRASRCAFYKERENYVKGARLLFTSVLDKYYEDGNKSILEVFASQFSSRSYTGKRAIYVSDKESFKEYCIRCALNIEKFLHLRYLHTTHTEFVYRGRIKGKIAGVLPNEKVNVFFSFKNSYDTEKELDIYTLSNYIYNTVNMTTNNCLVMSVPTDSYFHVNYNKRDYTIKRGWLSSTINTKVRRQGSHCTTCKNKCKPFLINGLNRLENAL